MSAALEQLHLFEPVPRWSFTRPWLRSPHRARATRELEQVRTHFPELDGITIRVGLTRRRRLLGLADLGGDPHIWIRPRRIHRFTIAHELTHLLQARGLVPRGERACDLFALARAAAYIDHEPSYLKIPDALIADGTRRALKPGAASLLHEAAMQAVGRRSSDVRYLVWFEKELVRRSAEMLIEFVGVGRGDPVPT